MCSEISDIKLYNRLKCLIEDLINNSVALATQLKLEQNKGYECYQLQHHKELIDKIYNNLDYYNLDFLNEEYND